ncbi:Rv3654c family TadE-like protein [Leifsonia sp. NPDC058230]|uniref:Rv3654c family TadE-like protein n=1 Tax=Leifsonia sp. NPDC058230 TaxID=3346391 RepID=UPI0036DC723A
MRVRGASAAGVTSRDGERGSATVLALGIVAALVCLSGGAIAAAGAAVAKQRVAGTADLAALAAADVASGALPGSPCSEAERVVRANGARLGACEVDGAVATVTASLSYLGFGVEVGARAGPPGSR